MPTPEERIKEIGQIATLYREQADLDVLRNKNVPIEIYFDTYHVLPIIQGYWELQSSVHNDISTDIFDDDRTLVKTLAYFEYIRDIHILLPHVAELANQLDKSYLLPTDEHVDKGKIDKFLEQIGLDNLKKLKTVYEKDGLESYLQELAPHSEQIFKANYILDELKWYRRYQRLFIENRIVQYDDVRYNNADILSSPLFEQISDALADPRSDRKFRTINNFRDAMALCMFQKKVQKFKLGQGALPFLYVAGGRLGKLPPEIRSEFVVQPPQLPNGTKVSLLKDSEFFIVDAMFTLKKKSKKGDALSDGMQRLEDSMQLYHRIGPELSMPEINAIIQEWVQLRKNDFFSKIWADGKGGRRKLSERLIDLVQMDAFVGKVQDSKKIVEREREAIIKNLTLLTDDLVFLEDIWMEIETFEKVLNDRLNEKVDLNVLRPDIFRDMGVTRFSPPLGPVGDEIGKIWNDFLILHSKRSVRRMRLLKVLIARVIYDGFQKITADSFSKILTGLCVLWAFHRYALIMRLVERLQGRYEKAYQIPLIYMASVLKQKDKNVWHLKVIEKHLKDLEASKEYPSTFEIWIGVGYVKFNVWQEFKSMQGKRNEQKFRDYLSEAIELMDRSYRYLKSQRKKGDLKRQVAVYRNVKYYYVLNNWVYYNLMGETDELDSKLFDSRVSELISIQRDEQYSQARFSDTIARFYYRAFEKAEDIADQLDAIQKAEIYIKDAYTNTIIKDELFETLHNTVVKSRQRTEAKMKKRK